MRYTNSDNEIIHSYQVERHIRLLDQAINDQEMILNGTMTAGTAANPVILPDLSVSRWVKPARNQNTLSDSEGDKKTGKEQVVDVPQSPDKEAPQKNKSRPKSRRKTELNQDTLKFVVPFTGTTGGEMGDDREEKRYCYCDGVSFGEVSGLMVLKSGALGKFSPPDDCL